MDLSGLVQGISRVGAGMRLAACDTSGMILGSVLLLVPRVKRVGPWMAELFLGIREAVIAWRSLREALGGGQTRQSKRQSGFP
jgi:hypothetical protein